MAGLWFNFTYQIVLSVLGVLTTKVTQGVGTPGLCVQDYSTHIPAWPWGRGCGLMLEAPSGPLTDSFASISFPFS